MSFYCLFSNLFFSQTCVLIQSDFGYGRGFGYLTYLGFWGFFSRRCMNRRNFPLEFFNLQPRSPRKLGKRGDASPYGGGGCAPPPRKECRQVPARFANAFPASGTQSVILGQALPTLSFILCLPPRLRVLHSLCHFSFGLLSP